MVVNHTEVGEAPTRGSADLVCWSGDVKASANIPDAICAVPELERASSLKAICERPRSEMGR